MSTRKSHIIITGEFSFPYGMAAGRYVFLMTKGLVVQGADLFVLPLKATELQDDIRNHIAFGCIDGINFKYATGSSIWKPNLFRRVLLASYAELNSIFTVSTRALMGKLDTLLYYGGSAYQFKKFSLLSKLFKYKLIAHIVEWDPELPGATTKQQKAALNFFQSVLKFSDGIVVISNFLEGQIAKQNHKCIPVFKLPILVDTDAWIDNETITFDKPYILYCANLESYIEDVFFILRSFADLNDKNINIKMIGYAGESALKEINKEIKKLNIEDRVTISSKFVDEKQLYKLFASANVLLAPMHDNNRSAARFPLKIADYLMSGRPVVSSHIGEVAATLKDGVSAFLAKPDDSTDFTKKIEIALTHPNSLQIALSGREIAMKNFDYKINGKRLLEFIHSIS